MDNPQRVYLIDRLTHLLHNKGNPSLRQRLRFLQLMVQLPSGAHLQDDVYIGRIIEATIHLDDVGVVEEHLDLDLSDELLSYLLFMQQLLLYHL